MYFSQPLMVNSQLLWFPQNMEMLSCPFPFSLSLIRIKVQLQSISRSKCIVQYMLRGKESMCSTIAPSFLPTMWFLVDRETKVQSADLSTFVYMWNKHTLLSCRIHGTFSFQTNVWKCLNKQEFEEGVFKNHFPCPIKNKKNYVLGFSHHTVLHLNIKILNLDFKITQ